MKCDAVGSPSLPVNLFHLQEGEINRLRSAEYVNSYLEHSRLLVDFYHLARKILEDPSLNAHLLAY